MWECGGQDCGDGMGFGGRWVSGKWVVCVREAGAFRGAGEVGHCLRVLVEGDWGDAFGWWWGVWGDVGSWWKMGTGLHFGFVGDGGIETGEGWGRGRGVFVMERGIEWNGV